MDWSGILVVSGSEESLQMDLAVMAHNVKYPIYSDPFANTCVREGVWKIWNDKANLIHLAQKITTHTWYLQYYTCYYLIENKLRHIEYIWYTTPPNMIPEVQLKNELFQCRGDSLWLIVKYNEKACSHHLLRCHKKVQSVMNDCQ